MKPRNTTNLLVVHCSDTPADMDIGAGHIRDWHVIDNGWSDIGYHYVITRDGSIQPGRPLDKVGAHVRGHNHNSVGICLVGGMGTRGQPEPNYTPEQYTALSILLPGLQTLYPEATVQGHRDFPGVDKDCPCFDVVEWLAGKA
ncbi:MAG: N-acetylmuramoyl-L-alanine amidase [Endozoicomonas sp.]